MRASPLATLMLLVTAPALTAQHALDTVWKCANPDRPFRYVTSEDRKDTPPPCEKWIELRGPRLAALLESLGDERFEAANVFLTSAESFSGFVYPKTAAGQPRATSEVYFNPGAFGLEVVSADSAAPGSLVLFNGLGGILLEAHDPETGTWSRRILYPSAAQNFTLFVADLQIPGLLQARVLRAPEEGV